MTEDGRFITFEGGEGTGKSTQSRLLAEALAAAGITVLRSREPGGAPGAEAIRRLLLEGETGRWDAAAEALLLAAARRDHVEHTVRPALTRGEWVISDRFADSTVAYQGYAGGVPLDELGWLHRFAVGDLRPDLTIVLDLDPKAGLARALGRGEAATRFERRGLAFHRRLRAGFLAIAKAEPDRCVVIGSAAPVATVHAAVCDAVRQRLGIALP